MLINQDIYSKDLEGTRDIWARGNEAMVRILEIWLKSDYCLGCKLLNLSLSLWSVKKLAILLFVIQLVNKQMHLKGTSPAHLEDVPNRRSQTTHRLFFLPVHLVVDGLLCLLLALSHFVLHPLNQTKSFNGETSLTAESL